MSSKGSIFSQDCLYLIVCLGLMGIGGLIFGASEVTLDILDKVAGILSFFITLIAAVFAFRAIEQWKIAREYDSVLAHNKAFALANLNARAKLSGLYTDSMRIFEDNLLQNVDFETYKVICLSKILGLYRTAIFEIIEQFYELNYTEHSLLNQPEFGWLRYEKHNMAFLGLQELDNLKDEFKDVRNSAELSKRVIASTNNMLVLINKTYKNHIT